MITKRNLTMVVVILAASFLGGVVGQRVFPARQAFAQVTGQGQAQQTFTAEQFILVDGNGIVRAVLNVSEDIPALLMLDADGNRLVGLYAAGIGPMLSLGADGQFGAELAAGDLAAGLVMRDGNSSAILGLAASGTGSSLALDDTDGNTRLLLSAGRHGPDLSMWDAAGNVRSSFHVDEDGTRLAMYDAHTDDARVVLGLLERGAALTFMDADGDLRILLHQDDDETVLLMSDDPRISMLNARGTNIWHAP